MTAICILSPASGLGRRWRLSKKRLNRSQQWGTKKVYTLLIALNRVYRVIVYSSYLKHPYFTNMAGSSSLLDTPKARISSEGLTYGVELEFVFAFHQDELLAVFDDAVYGEECFLQKHIPYCVREGDVFTPIPLIDLPNHVYNSWGIMYTEPKSREGMTAPYQMEPMRIVGNKLSEKYPDFRYRIRPAINEEDKTKDIYYTWIVTRDYSVCGVGSENIPAWLNRNNIDSREWDSIGIEVVSRVLNSASPEGKHEIEKVIDAVKGGGNDSYGAFITNQ